MMSVLFALILVVVLVASWFLTVLGLPGNWLMVAATAVYAYLAPAQSAAVLGWRTIVTLLVLATLGEIVELVAGALGVTKAGGSTRGALMALVGSIVGGIFGLLVGVPIPLIGPIVAAVLFAGLGAMAGALLGEMWAGQHGDATWRIAKLAFWGRLWGTVGKILIGAVMVAVVVAALLL
jgi:uncharacterized protein YqgC (DUF456 family)